MLFKRKNKMNDWLITDHVILIEDFVYNQHPDFCNKLNIDKSKQFVCLRNYKGERIYIDQTEFTKFTNISDIYCNQMINLTNLLKYQVYSTIYAVVSNQVIPQQAFINRFKKCCIKNIDVYIIYSEELTRADSLFNELITLKNMKDQHHIK